MDFVGSLKQAIDELPAEGPRIGLAPVVSHIEMAIRHWERGKADADPALFTDAVYRCNQAFEGSLKEMYRVLTGTSPERKTPNAIEAHLRRDGLFRDRVLNQIARYRTEWRNPSTHDYTLDFDGNEAFIAITSIVACAMAAVGQIALTLSFQEGQKNEAIETPQVAPQTKLITKIQDLALNFFNSYRPPPHDLTRYASTAETIGNFAGFLSRYPDLSVQVERAIGKTAIRADMIITRRDESVLVELKGVRAGNLLFPRQFAALRQLLEADTRSSAVLIFYSTDVTQYRAFERQISDGRKVVTVAPNYHLPEIRAELERL